MFVGVTVWIGWGGVVSLCSCLVAYYCRATVEFRQTQVNYTAQFTSQSNSLCSRAQPLLIFSFQTSPRGNDSNTKVSETDTKHTNYDGLCSLLRPPTYSQFRKCNKYVDILKNIWIKTDQLDVTCFIISLFTAQHVSNISTSIFRSLRLIVDLSHVLYCSGSMCVGVTVWFGWGGVVSLCRLKY